MANMIVSKQPTLTPDQVGELVTSARELLEQCKAVQLLSRLRGFNTEHLNGVISRAKHLLEACDGR